MQDRGYELRRTPLPRSWVNRASLATNPATHRRSKIGRNPLAVELCLARCLVGIGPTGGRPGFARGGALAENLACRRSGASGAALGRGPRLRFAEAQGEREDGGPGHGYDPEGGPEADRLRQAPTSGGPSRKPP
jgi:hypothetical protein